jgi:hypothetical protein
MGTRKRGAVRLSTLALGLLAIIVCLGPNKLYAQPQAIDVNKSSLKVRVFKSGDGKIDYSTNPSLQLRLDSRKMLALTRRPRSPSVP